MIKVTIRGDFCVCTRKGEVEDAINLFVNKLGLPLKEAFEGFLTLKEESWRKEFKAAVINRKFEEQYWQLPDTPGIFFTYTYFDVPYWVPVHDLVGWEPKNTQLIFGYSFQVSDLDYDIDIYSLPNSYIEEFQDKNRLAYIVDVAKKIFFIKEYNKAGVPLALSLKTVKVTLFPSKNTIFLLYENFC